MRAPTTPPPPPPLREGEGEGGGEGEGEGEEDAAAQTVPPLRGLAKTSSASRAASRPPQHEEVFGDLALRCEAMAEPRRARSPIHAPSPSRRWLPAGAGE